MVLLPKRRKYKDNPYTLNTIDNKFYIIFRDGLNIPRTIEVNKNIYNLFNQFELDDLKELNEFDNHIEHSEIFENSLEKRMKNKPASLEDEIIKKSTFEELKNAIKQLPDIQKRRIIKYYFEDKTQQQIADEEMVDIRAIQYSLNIALKKLKEILK